MDWNKVIEECKRSAGLAQDEVRDVLIEIARDGHKPLDPRLAWMERKKLETSLWSGMARAIAIGMPDPIEGPLPRKIAGPWRCFHCGEVCATEAHAREHFGGVRGALTACQLKGSDRHLIEVIRDQEEQLASYRAEDNDILRAMYSAEADHRTALQKAEERGYEKGVADMKAQGLCADPKAHAA